MRMLFWMTWVLIGSLSSLADDSAPDSPSMKAEFKIKQIMSTEKLVVVEPNAPLTVPLKPGRLFIVTFPDQRQCTLKSLENGDSHIVLSAAQCDRVSEIHLGLPIELSIINLESFAGVPENVSSSSDDKISQEGKPLETDNMSLSLHYSMANQIFFSGAAVNSPSAYGTVTATFNTSRSLGIGFSYASLKPHEWGYMWNVLFEPGREVESVSFSGAGGVSSGTFSGTRPKLTFFVVEGNAAYRWNKFYLPFGLNYSGVALTDYTGSNIQLRGGLGVYIGGGVVVGSSSSVELFVRGIGFRMTEASISGSTTIDYGYGSISGFGFGYKHWF